MAWRSVNAMARILNHISLERAGRQYSDKVCGICITSVGVEIQLWLNEHGQALKDHG